jgi:hypothetical protein
MICKLIISYVAEVPLDILRVLSCREYMPVTDRMYANYMKAWACITDHRTRKAYRNNPAKELRLKQILRASLISEATERGQIIIFRVRPALNLCQTSSKMLLRPFL